jgi:hypothetical protein
MATLRRALVDKVKKAASKVSTRGVQVAAKAGTRGARALVETTVVAVKTVDKIQQTLGRRSNKANSIKETLKVEQQSKTTPRQTPPQTSAPMTSKAAETQTAKTQAKTPSKAPAKTEGSTAKPSRATSERASEAQPVEMREAGRKTMPAAAPKRSKQAPAAGKQFKVKRGQKHLHSGR